MKLSVSIGLVLSLACLALFTGRLVGQQDTRRPGFHQVAEPTVPAVAKRSDSSTKALGREAGAKVADRTVTIVPLSECGLESFQLMPLKAGVDIEARVSLMDTDRNTSYLWSILVQDRAATNTFLEHYYTTQAFRIQEVEAADHGPAFSEHLKLSPGTYRIKVALLGIPDGFLLEEIKQDKAFEERLIRVCGVGIVTVPKRGK